MNTTKAIALKNKDLNSVTGGYSTKPYNCGAPANQYDVRIGNQYYYHYTGGGHDQWIVITIESVYEKPKFLWTTERFAVVTYENGMHGELPLDTGDVYYICA